MLRRPVQIREAGLREHNALRLEKNDIDAAAALKLIQGAESLVESLK